RSAAVAPLRDGPASGLRLGSLRQRALAHFDPQRNILMPHASIPPIWSVEQTCTLAAEVSAALRDDQRIPGFLDDMYGNEPACWSDSLEEIGRASCRERGEMRGGGVASEG